MLNDRQARFAKWLIIAADGLIILYIIVNYKQ